METDDNLMNKKSTDFLQHVPSTCYFKDMNQVLLENCAMSSVIVIIIIITRNLT